MPMITVRYVTNDGADDLRARIANAVRDVTVDALGKSSEVIAILVEPADSSAWFIGGASVAHSGVAAFWLEITITAGTNTKDETSVFVARVFERMGNLLGPLDERSYAHVIAADGDGYGYGGRTQNARWADRAKT